MQVHKQVPAYLRLLRTIYQDVLVKKYKHQNFWMLSTFIPTFIVARMVVHLFPSLFFQFGGEHVHHFTYGFIILAICGYLAITRPSKSPPWLAALFGIGLALSVDEAGMWLHLTDVYYNDTSEDVVIVTGAVLINLVYFKEFWVSIIRNTLRLFRVFR
ncbi:MAG TPA: hypothetical protein VFP32_01900 [Candidatus Saccharimonadales bacterium]|nr:hypothetical protein [Candidatus Saccharimonadales bacterium]